MKRASLSFGGTTLVELIFVVGIVTVLIGLLIPSFQFYQEEARSAQCIGNLRHIFSGVAIYSGENEGFVPAPNDLGYSSGIDLPIVLEDYAVTENAFRCPKDKPGASYGFEVPGYCSSYIYLGADGIRIGEDQDDDGKTMSASLVHLLKDMGYVHRGYQNTAFIDGHVEHKRANR